MGKPICALVHAGYPLCFVLFCCVFFELEGPQPHCRFKEWLEGFFHFIFCAFPSNVTCCTELRLSQILL